MDFSMHLSAGLTVRGLVVGYADLGKDSIPLVGCRVPLCITTRLLGFVSRR